MTKTIVELTPKNELDLRLRKFLNLPDKVNLCWLMSLHTSSLKAPEASTGLLILWNHICDHDRASTGGLRLNQTEDAETMKKLYELDTLAKLDLEVTKARVKLAMLRPETRQRCEAVVVADAERRSKVGGGES